MTRESNLYIEPVLHDTRNELQVVSFTNTHVIIELADGRIIGVPLRFFPLLKAETNDERQYYRLGACDVYWEDIDDGIDLKAMLSGLYLETSEEDNDYLKNQVSERRAKATTT